jgi:hypothetical protein
VFFVFFLWASAACWRRLLRYVPRLANARPRLRRVWPAAAGHRYTSLGRWILRGVYALVMGLPFLKKMLKYKLNYKLN